MRSLETAVTLPADFGTVAGQVNRISLPSEAAFMRLRPANPAFARISPTLNSATRSLGRQSSSTAVHRMNAIRSLSRSPLSQARSGLFGAWDIVTSRLLLARDSIRTPDLRQRRSGTRRRLIFVAHILLLEEYRSSSIISKPPRAKMLATLRVPIAPMLTLRRNSLSLLNPTAYPDLQAALGH